MAFSVVTVSAVGAAGAGVPAVVVVIVAGAADKLATEKLNGPPATLVVVFRMETVAGFAVLVMVQVIWAAGKTLAAGTVSTALAKLPKLAGFPVKPELASVHMADVAVKLGVTVSVT